MKTIMISSDVLVDGMAGMLRRDKYSEERDMTILVAHAAAVVGAIIEDNYINAPTKEEFTEVVAEAGGLRE